MEYQDPDSTYYQQPILLMEEINLEDICMQNQPFKLIRKIKHNIINL